MINKIKNNLFGITSTLGFVLTIIGLIFLGLVLSYALFTLGYWLISLILLGFFNFILPFSFWYSFGAWLILLIIGFFIAPGIFTTFKIKD